MNQYEREYTMERAKELTRLRQVLHESMIEHEKEINRVRCILGKTTQECYKLQKVLIELAEKEANRRNANIVRITAETVFNQWMEEGVS